MNIFDSFWPFFLKRSDSVWQTFLSLNTVTQCDKLFFIPKYSDSVWKTFFSTQWSFFVVNLFSENIRKLVYLSKTNFNIEEFFFRVPQAWATSMLVYFTKDWIKLLNLNLCCFVVNSLCCCWNFTCFFLQTFVTKFWALMG